MLYVHVNSVVSTTWKVSLPNVVVLEIFQKGLFNLFTDSEKQHNMEVFVR